MNKIQFWYPVLHVDEMANFSKMKLKQYDQFQQKSTVPRVRNAVCT